MQNFRQQFNTTKIVSFNDNQMVEISLRKIQAEDLKELLKFAFYADKAAFINEFKNSDVVFINDPAQYDQQLDFLAYLGNSGADKGGKLRKPDGTPVHFSVWGALSRINVDHDNLNNSGIKLVA